MMLSFENKIINQFQVTVFKKPRGQHIINREQSRNWTHFGICIGS